MQNYHVVNTKYGISINKWMDCLYSFRGRKYINIAHLLSSGLRHNKAPESD